MLGLSTASIATFEVYVTAVPFADGSSTLVAPDGRVVSCQPDGRLEWRPAGTDGVYERCTLKGGLARFNPQGPNGPGFAFAIGDVPVTE